MAKTDPLSGSYTRKRFITVAASATFLASCGGTQSSSSGGGGSTTPSDGGEIEDTLSLYNWEGYVDPENIKIFERQTGVTVQQDFFSTVEEMEAKLQAGGGGYDIVVPPEFTIKNLGPQGTFTELDWALLPNVEANIDPTFQGLPSDPEGSWSVPKNIGTTGYIYRTDEVTERPSTWQEFVDLAMGPYSGKVTVLEAPLETIGAMCIMHGGSYNTDDPAILDKAKETLLELKPHILAITSSQYKQMLLDGKSVLSMGWNGDGVAVASEKPAAFVLPDEGAEIWLDNWAILSDAEHPRAAHEWINFLYEPEAAARELKFILYGSPVKGDLLKPLVDPELIDNPAVFPTQEQLDRLEYNDLTPEGTKARNRIWTEFKSA